MNIKEQAAMNPNKENNENQKNNFNLIIGIATLLIAILGATFAYFSATVRSPENDVTVKSAYVSISYDGGTEIKASNLIPSSLTVAINKYQKNMNVYNPETDGEIKTDYDAYTNDLDRRCVDANGREVCYVYQFTIESDGEAGQQTEILATIKINQNQFENLSYMVYEVDLDEVDGQYQIDKYGMNIIKPNGYTYLTNNFTSVDTNPDNILYQDYTFEKFKKPTDIYNEDGEYQESIYPVACIFGYAEDSEDKALDDTSRCAPYAITNKVKHTYQMIIWLEETGKEQPEQGLTFAGTVAIEVGGTESINQITGTD